MVHWLRLWLGELILQARGAAQLKPQKEVRRGAVFGWARLFSKLEKHCISRLRKQWKDIFFGWARESDAANTFICIAEIKDDSIDAETMKELLTEETEWRCLRLGEIVLQARGALQLNAQEAVEGHLLRLGK